MSFAATGMASDRRAGGVQVILLVPQARREAKSLGLANVNIVFAVLADFH